MCEVLTFDIPIKESVKGMKLLIPDLNAAVVSYRNSICRSRYDQGVRCFWEGDLEVVLDVEGKKIVLNDHDDRQHKKGYFTKSDHTYHFVGKSSKVVNKRDTFLVLEVQICR